MMDDDAEGAGEEDKEEEEEEEEEGTVEEESSAKVKQLTKKTRGRTWYNQLSPPKLGNKKSNTAITHESVEW